MRAGIRSLVVILASWFMKKYSAAIFEKIDSILVYFRKAIYQAKLSKDFCTRQKFFVGHRTLFKKVLKNG